MEYILQKLSEAEKWNNFLSSFVGKAIFHVATCKIMYSIIHAFDNHLNKIQKKLLFKKKKRKKKNSSTFYPFRILLN